MVRTTAHTMTVDNGQYTASTQKRGKKTKKAWNRRENEITATGGLFRECSNHSREQEKRHVGDSGIGTEDQGRRRSNDSKLGLRVRQGSTPLHRYVSFLLGVQLELSCKVEAVWPVCLGSWFSSDGGRGSEASKKSMTTTHFQTTGRSAIDVRGVG
ncbi:hypothetical protein LZ30DRAFT_164206 [Colletotrichum cereale]|nr:hypothetical protein LZ30DRAFT_164206 [Colletotrichum cereale]